MANIEIEVQDQDVRDALNRLISQGVGDLSPVMRRIAGAMESGVEDAFQSERSPAGVPWSDLSDVTTQRRKSQQRIKKLQVTGDLAGSIHSRHDARSASVGTNLVYAATHQFGAAKGAFGSGSYKTRKGSFPIPWGHIPARPFLGLSAETRDDIIEALNRHINTTWER